MRAWEAVHQAKTEPYPWVTLLKTGAERRGASEGVVRDRLQQRSVGPE